MLLKYTCSEAAVAVAGEEAASGAVALVAGPVAVLHAHAYAALGHVPGSQRADALCCNHTCCPKFTGCMSCFEAAVVVAERGRCGGLSV